MMMKMDLVVVVAAVDIRRVEDVVERMKNISRA